MTHARPVLATMALLLASAPALAQLYAYDQAGEQLGVFDPGAGTFTPVGPLSPPDGSFACMEFLGSRLFVLESVFPDPGWLLEVDPATAAVLSRHQITRAGVPLTGALDSLGADDGVLYLAHNHASHDISESDTLSPIDPSGAVDPLTFFTPHEDSDGVCGSADGGLWLVDREPDPGDAFCRLYRAGSPPMAAALVGTYAIGPTLDLFQEIADSGALLYVCDPFAGRVHHVDRATGAIVGHTDEPAGRSLKLLAWRATPTACNAADLAPPFGVLNFDDVIAFLVAFGAMQPSADLAPPQGVFDFSDVLAYLTLFAAGCP